MWDNFITRQMKRTNRNLLIAGVVLLAGAAGLTAGYRRYLYNFVLGPFPIQTAELAAIQGPEEPQKYFLRVQGEKAYDTGVYLEVQDSSKKRTANFYALKVGERFLIVKASPGEKVTSYAGGLATLPYELRTGYIARSEAKNPALLGAFLPFMLDATGFRDSDGIMGVGAGAVMLLLGLYLTWLFVQRNTNPEKHPLMKSLEKYGTPNDVAMQIDSELRSEPASKVTGDLLVTKNWLIHASAFRTVLMQTREVIWAYQKITKHYHNGIPTGKSFSTVIRDSRGQTAEIQGKKKTAPDVVNALQQRMPWIISGFSKELEQAWKNDRAGLAQAVEKRRATLAAAH
jgi:uncharacterized protein DUF6709